jgi:hypothetical protein
MKKIAFLLTLLYVSLVSFNMAYGQLTEDKKSMTQLGQAPSKGNSNIPDCFCCGKAYNLNPPVINGPSVIKCQTTAKWTWEKCEGTVVGRNFSPFPPGGNGGGDDVSAYLNWPAGYSGTVTLTVTFLCGEKKVTVQKQIKIESCCDCSKLPSQFTISGQQLFCLKKNCNDILTYTAPKLDDTCFKYQWTVSPAAGFTGQGTNQIRISCTALKTGSYTIALSIRCGDRTVSSTTPLLVCSPAPVAISGIVFTPNSTGTCVTVTPAASATEHWWYIVEDNDKSCNYSNGEKYIGPVPSSGTAPGLLCPDPLFSLTNNKSYVVYHMTFSQCGNIKNQGCWNLGTYCFSYNYPPEMKLAKPVIQPKLEKISESEIQSIKLLPAELLNKLPNEIQTRIKDCRSCNTDAKSD